MTVGLILATHRHCRPPAQLGKAGGVVDRRFGEGDPELDPEARALARMARLRLAQLGSIRRSTFTLGGAGSRAACTACAHRVC